MPSKIRLLAAVAALTLGPACIACPTGWSGGTLTAGALAVSSRVTEDLGRVIRLDGVLVTEVGTLHGGFVQGLWRGSLRDVCFELGAEFDRATGHTDYSGFVQTQVALVPLRAITGNDVNNYAFNAGVLWSLAPSLHAGFVATRTQSRWLRSLVNYTERHDSLVTALGLQFIDRITPSWAIELALERGVKGDGQLSVIQQGVQLEVPLRSWSRINVGVNAEVDRALAVNFKFSVWRRIFDASDATGAFIQPPMKIEQKVFGVGLIYGF